MRRTSTTTLFLSYTLVRLVVIVALGVVIVAILRGDARSDGSASRYAEAGLIATTDVEPALHGHAPRGALGAVTRRQLATFTSWALHSGDLTGLQLSGVDGQLLFRAGDTAPVPGRAVLTRVPVELGTPPRRVGSLDVLLPSAAAGATAWLGPVEHDLALGLAALFVVLFTIALLVNNGFRRQILARTYLAEHDELTDLPNRSAFHLATSTAVTPVGTAVPDVTVAILDLDRFKVINDTLGHSVGDALLAELGARLAAQLRPGDTVARLGGDEFGLVLHDCEDPPATLWRVRASLEREVAVRGLPLTVDASIGYVTAAGDLDTDALLQRAEIAMYEAKARHAGILRYDPSQDHYDEQNLVLAGELRRAIDDGELVLHYQPQARFSDRVTCSLESLVRWQHPSMGLLVPRPLRPPRRAVRPHRPPDRLGGPPSPPGPGRARARGR